MEKKKLTKTYIKVRRAERPRSYTNVPNHLIQSENISFRAKGLLIYFMSLPANYFISPEVIAKDFKLGKHAYYQTIKELKLQGYLQHVKHRDTQGRIIGADYIIHDEPTISPELKEKSTTSNSDCQDPDYQDPDYQDLDNQDLDEQDLEKQTQYNKYNNKINNKKTNSNKRDAADVLIRPELTVNQLNAIRTAIANMSNFLPYDEEQMFDDIAYTILDENAFTKSEGIFYKKLNSIVKVIRQGNWLPPAKPYLEQEKQKTERLSELQQELQQCQAEINHWQKIKQWNEDAKDEVQIKNCNELIAKYTKVKESIENQLKSEDENAATR